MTGYTAATDCWLTAERMSHARTDSNYFFIVEGTMTRIPLSAADEQSRSQQARLEMSTAEIGLSVRTTNCLEERGIFTVQDLLNCTREDLLSISNFGEKTLDEVFAALESVGFYRPNHSTKSPK